MVVENGTSLCGAIFFPLNLIPVTGLKFPIYEQMTKFIPVTEPVRLPGSYVEERQWDMQGKH